MCDSVRSEPDCHRIHLRVLLPLFYREQLAFRQLPVDPKLEEILYLGMIFFDIEELLKTPLSKLSTLIRDRCMKCHPSALGFIQFKMPDLKSVAEYESWLAVVIAQKGEWVKIPKVPQEGKN